MPISKSQHDMHPIYFEGNGQNDTTE